MRSLIVIGVAIYGSLCVTTLPVAAEQTQADAKKPGNPAPRLADGHIDLGNGKGVWDTKKVADMSGHGGGETPGPALQARQLKVLDRQVDVVMLPWAQQG